MPTLENWSITRRPSSDPYKAPELWPLVLQGNVSNDYRFLHNEPITTSRIVEFHPFDPNGGWAATRSGTVYKLGSISSEWTKYMKENKYTLEQYEHLFQKENNG